MHKVKRGRRQFVEDFRARQVPKDLHWPLLGAQLLDHQIECPERVLLVAVLTRAVLDRFEPNRLIRSSANRWFESESVDRFSYRWICIHLGLRPEQGRALTATILKNHFIAKRGGRNPRLAA